MRRFKLRNKFVLLLIVVSLTPLILTVALTYFRFQRTLEQHASQLQNQLSATAAVEIKSFIISQVGILETIATVYNPEFTTNSKEVTKILENILYKSDNFTTISIVDKKGQEIARQDRILVVTPSDFRDLSTTLAFNTVKEKGLYIGPIYIEGGKPSFDLGRWIVDAQGNFLGAVFAKVDAKIMPQVTSKISSIAGPGGRVYMVNEKGIVVAYSDFSYILGERDLSNLPTISNIISGNTDIKISQIYYNEKDDYVLGSAYPIIIEPLDIKLPEPYKINWFVITEQPTSEVFAEIYNLALYSVLLSLLVVLIAIAVAVFFARRISAPVEALHLATEEFGKGNFSYRTKIDTNDEIGDLARNFDTMAGSLENSIKNLKAEEEIISAERDKLRVILSGITNAVIAVDLKRNVILFNKAAELLMEMTESEVLGKPIESVTNLFEKDTPLSTDEYCPVKSKDNKAEGVVFRRNNLKLISQSGQEHYVNLISAMISERRSIQLGCILTFQDITRELAMEKTKAEFVTIAAHQLRTPLTGMKWSLDFLFGGDSGQLNTEQKEMVGDVSKATGHMIDLVNSLLDVSQIEEGRFGITKKNQSLVPILERVGDTFKKPAEEKGVILKTEIITPLPDINLDSVKIEMALNNLVDNAIRYSLPNGTVELKAQEENGQVMVTIKDTGIGIAPEDYEKIFTKFFRSNKALHHDTEGTGLGLYVSKNIIEQHGGKIGFDSKDNEGTEFYISLPTK